MMEWFIIQGLKRGLNANIITQVPYDDYGIAKYVLLSELLQYFMHSIVGILAATTVK